MTHSSKVSSDTRPEHEHVTNRPPGFTRLAAMVFRSAYFRMPSAAPAGPRVKTNFRGCANPGPDCAPLFCLSPGQGRGSGGNPLTLFGADSVGVAVAPTLPRP